jgi:serine/threonine protein kinase
LSSAGERLQCYHLDLKPHNILVVVENGREMWKITDFGMSKVRPLPTESRRPLRRARTLWDLEDVFKPVKGHVDKDSCTVPPVGREIGTYIAPEAANHMVDAKATYGLWVAFYRFYFLA